MKDEGVPEEIRIQVGDKSYLPGEPVTVVRSDGTIEHD